MSKRGFRSVLAVATLALVIASATGAVAEESRSVAAEQFDRGVRLFQQGEYEASLEAFERSYEAHQHERTLYNIANCQRALGHYRESIESFELYLNIQGSSVPPATRTRIEQLIREMRSRLGTLRITTVPVGAQVLINGEELPLSPEGEIHVRMGPHTITVVAPEYRMVSRRVSVAAGEVTVVNVVLEPVPIGVPNVGAGQDQDTNVSEEPLPPERPIYRRWWFWTLIGGAVAATSAGVGLGVAEFPDVGSDTSDWNVRLP